MRKLFKQLIENNPIDSIVKLIYRCLYNEIIVLHLPPGSKLNLLKISNELNVSGTTVRDAATMLLKDDLVEMRCNQGFFVSKLNIKELSDIMAARKIIESNAVKLLCEKISEEQINILQNIVALMENSLNKEKYNDFVKLDEVFHQTIINFCDNEFIIMMYNSIADNIKRYGFYLAMNLIKTDNTKFQKSYRQHLNIVKSLKNSMIENSYILIKNHLDECEKLFNYVISKN